MGDEMYSGTATSTPRRARPTAVGLTLTPGPARWHALLIVGVPLVLLLLFSVPTHGSGRPAPADFGQNPFGVFDQPGPAPTDDGGTTQYQAQATDPQTTEPQTTDAQATDPETTDPQATDPETTTPAGTTGADGPAATVQAAYAAINNGDYQSAYQLGLGRPGQSYTDFAAGYADTASVSVRIVAVDGDTVSVELSAIRNDGTQHSYSGTYTVSGGVIADSDIQQVS